MLVPEMLYNYSYDNRERFNPVLFERNDDDIVEELKRVILACQRDQFYTIKVNSFDIIEYVSGVFSKITSVCPCSLIVQPLLK